MRFILHLMEPGYLSEEQRNGLNERLSTEKDARVLDKIRAVLLHDMGYSFTDIGTFQFLHPETISRHIQEYLEQEKLSIDSGGSKSKLTELQTDQLLEHLSSNRYTKVIEICHYVNDTYGVSYSISGMTDWLHLHGFSYRKPPNQPAKADIEEQERFIQEYGQLKEKCQEDEPILFLDGVHPTMQTKIAYGWVLKGKKAKPVKTSGNRHRMNILGAVELATMNLISADFERLDSKAMGIFLGQIRNAYPQAQKIHVILDGAGYNKSAETKKYAEKHGIELHFLPTYSPNLNASERVWKVMNETVRNNKFFSSVKEFREAITNFFKKDWFTMNQSMKSRINDNFQRFKPAV